MQEIFVDVGNAIAFMQAIDAGMVRRLYYQ